MKIIEKNTIIRKDRYIYMQQITIIILSTLCFITIYFFIINREYEIKINYISIFAIIICMILLELFVKNRHFFLFIFLKPLLFALLGTSLINSFLKINFFTNLQIYIWSGFIIVSQIFPYAVKLHLINYDIMNSISIAWTCILVCFILTHYLNAIHFQNRKQRIQIYIYLGSILILVFLLLTERIITLDYLLALNRQTFYLFNIDSLQLISKIHNYTPYLLICFFIIYYYYTIEQNKILLLKRDVEEKENEINYINNIQNIAVQSEDLTSTIENIVKLACLFADADGGIFYHFQEQNDNFVAKKVIGNVIPPFYTQKKVLADHENIIKKILETQINKSVGIFSHISEFTEPIIIKRERNDKNRKFLNYLYEYKEYIGSMLIGAVKDGNKLLGCLILQNRALDFTELNRKIFTSICKMASVLLLNVEVKKLYQEKLIRDNELNIAKQIQTGMLPKNIKIPGHEISTFMQSVDEVGGDYFDIIRKNSNNFWINIGDVSGHGLSAGLISMILQTATLMAIEADSNIAPEHLMILNNKVIYDIIKNRLYYSQFITALFLRGNEAGQYYYTGAHENIFIYRAQKNRVETITVDGIWLGLVPDIKNSAKISIGKFKLESNDILFLYTDGVTETRNPYKEIFSDEKIMIFLQRNGQKNANEIKELFLSELNEFKHNAKQQDDVTFIVVKKK